jgi:hypothetical protein
MREDMLNLIYELLNNRDLSPDMELRIKEELELQGCCETRIEFERHILVRFRRASTEGGCCPDRLRRRIIALLETME